MLDDELRAEIESRREDGLHRELRVVPPDVLDLASNDYLGLARDPRVIEAAVAATREFGAGARASRLVSGQTVLHEELETALAGWKESEAALCFRVGGPLMSLLYLASRAAWRCGFLRQAQSRFPH